MEDWIEKDLGSLFIVSTGNTPPKKVKDNYGNFIPFIKPPQLVNQSIGQAQEFLSKKGSEKGRVLPPLSILVTCIGNLGRVGINKTKVAFNQQINAIHAHQLVNSFFIFYQAQSPYFRQQLEEKSSATTVAIVNKGSFESVKFRLPPLPIQKAIVQKLESLLTNLDQGVASLEKAAAQLKIYRQAVLKKAFEGELTKAWREQQTDLPTAEELLAQIKEERLTHYEQQLQDWEQAVTDWEAEGKVGRKPSKPRKLKELLPIGEEELEKVPKGWKWIALEELADIIGGVTKGRKLDGKETIDLPYLRVANVQDGYLDLTLVKKVKVLPSDLDKYRLIYGDILYTEGGDRDKLGRGTIWKDEIENCIHQNHIFRARLYLKEIKSKYITYYSQSRGAKKYFYDNGKHTTNLASINKGVLSGLPVKVCSFKEQVKIVEEIESRLSVCDNLAETIETSLKKAKALRQSILKKAFEGRLLTEAELAACRAASDYEPAAVLLERIKKEKAERAALAKEQKKKNKKQKKLIS